MINKYPAEKLILKIGWIFENYNWLYPFIYFNFSHEWLMKQLSNKL